MVLLGELNSACTSFTYEFYSIYNAANQRTQTTYSKNMPCVSPLKNITEPV